MIPIYASDKFSINLNYSMNSIKLHYNSNGTNWFRRECLYFLPIYFGAVYLEEFLPIANYFREMTDFSVKKYPKGFNNSKLIIRMHFNFNLLVYAYIFSEKYH